MTETALIMSLPEELLMLTRMQQRDRGYTDSAMRSAAKKIEGLCAAGDLLAHDLAKYGRSNDGWWAVRGGHQNCTVCSIERYDCPIHGTGEGTDCPRC